MKKNTTILFFLIIAVFACKKDTTLAEDSNTKPYTASPYSLRVPPKFPEPILPAFNPLTVEGIKLGRMLYYDPILSTNGLSCSSCHIRSKSFSSPLFTSKTGVLTSIPPHINLAWNPDYNWNGSEPVLDRLCLGDFGPDFFNTNMDELVLKFKNHADYPLLFKQAFNIDDLAKLSHEQLQLKIVYAISQFMRTMISSQSRYDKWVRHEIVFTPQEMEGLDIFFTEKGDCFHCHGYPLLSSNNYHNTGLDSMPSGAQTGHYQVTHNHLDIGKFSAPTLRNVELTAPYMHDGRFNSLEEVVEFYNSGVHWTSPNIDPLMTKPAKIYGLNLTPLQKQNLVLFLKSFTDTAFINNPEFKSPFY